MGGDPLLRSTWQSGKESRFPSDPWAYSCGNASNGSTRLARLRFALVTKVFPQVICSFVGHERPFQHPASPA
jgi:hypothetical protein